MIRFVYGTSGSGKSTYIRSEIARTLREGKSAVLLCPEQEAVIAEEALTAELSGKVPTAELEILNFGRLPERVFREFGGLTKRDIGTGGRRVIMKRALTEAQPVLKTYGDAAQDTAMIDRVLSGIADFKMNRITPEALETAAAELSVTQSGLADKLSDFSVIYAVYEHLLQKEYSDPEDDLLRLYELLCGEGNRFFRGKNVYLDGFNGFTAQQYAIIGRILDTAENVTVTLCCTRNGEKEWMLRKVYETEDTLFRMLRDRGMKADFTDLAENRRTQDPALLRVVRELFSVGTPEQTEANGSVRIFSCPDPFAEAEAVAVNIRKQILAGKHYRDITVILRGCERYEGILDTVFEKYGIPAYMAKRSMASSKPFFRYLRCLFDLYIRGYRMQDVFGILKTGLCSIDEDDAFRFENYLVTWNLSGKAVSDGEEWNMHPLGYREQITEEDRALLARVNAVKAQFTNEFSPFFDRLRGNILTVKEISALLWEHLVRAAIPEKLSECAERERGYGDLSGAEETEQIWDLFVGILDSLVTVAGDIPCRLQDFAELLDLMLSDVDIGSIPARCDEVVIGDAGILRAVGAKHVYLVGCTEGIFPKTPEEDTVFSDREKKVLREHGVRLTAMSTEQTQDELFFFWFACAAAEEGLTLTYPCADLTGKAFRPSSGVERVQLLFSDAKPFEPLACSPEETLVYPDAAWETMAYTGDTPLGAALLDYYTAEAENNERYRFLLASLSEPVVQRRNRLSEETTAVLFGDRISMTQSRLEKYVLCHFAYFCGYVLKLKEQKRVTFGSADIGTFVHYVLCAFMEQYADDPEKEKYKDDAYVASVISQLVSAYAGMIGGNTKTGRVGYLLARLEKTAVVTVRALMHEFENSDFRPRDFELPVGPDDGSSIPALRIDAPDGTQIRLYGQIDRVDTYEKDGTTYVRVVDYKTYVKKFSLDDVAAGINLQMLLYLFSVWKNGGVRYPGTIVPAGVLYMTAEPPEISHDTLPERGEVYEAAEEGLGRSGLFLDDRDVLDAMEHGLGGRFIPVRLNKNGTYRKGAPVETLEEFGILEKQIEKTVCELTAEMKKGNADAVPISRSNPETGQNPCEYCEMKPVCRAL